MSLQTRSDAIAFLRSAGLFASERDWALGESIVIPAGIADEHAGITVYSRVLYIYPAAGAWTVLDLGPAPPTETAASSLAAACELVVAMLGAPPS